MKPRAFNLRAWFAICSFGMIALICVLSAWWVSTFLTATLLERESEVSQEFMESIVSVNGSRMFADDGSEPYHVRPELLDFSRHILSMPGVLRVNIHATTKRVLWSTEDQLIGKIFDKNDERDRAFQGQRITEIGNFDNDNKAEHVALGRSGHFIEAYIPIRAEGGRGPVIGVIEFYKMPAALQGAIDSARRAVWIVAPIAGLFLFLALYWIVQRGARLILRQQQNLVQMEALAAIGQMAGAVAHSLRNPMSAIRSSAELWRSQADAESRQAADEVIGEVDRMDGYVRDLLAYARSEPYHLQPVNPVKVIDTIVAKQRGAIDRHNVEVQTKDIRDLPKHVMADERLLEQALTSVITNAIEAMPEGGKLDVSVAPDLARDFVRIEIVDTGRGIPTELLERVKESYFTTKVRGLGLGLVVASGIIERFQGKLDITSDPGLGTRVLVKLKAA